MIKTVEHNNLKLLFEHYLITFIIVFESLEMHIFILN